MYTETIGAFSWLRERQLKQEKKGMGERSFKYLTSWYFFHIYIAHNLLVSISINYLQSS